MTQLYVSRGKYAGYQVIAKVGSVYQLDATLDANGQSIIMGGGLFDTEGGLIQTGAGNIDTEGGNILLGGGDVTELDDILFNVHADRNITNSASTLALEVESGAIVIVDIANTTEYTFSNTTLDMGGNILSEVALIQGLTTTNKLDDTTSGWLYGAPTSHRFAIGGANQMQIANGVISVEDCYIDQQEIASPSAPSANTSRLFTKDNGAGKTQLVVIFSSGAEQVIATQP